MHIEYEMKEFLMCFLIWIGVSESVYSRVFHCCCCCCWWCSFSISCSLTFCFFSLKSSCFPFLYVSIYFIILSLNINLCHQIHTVGWWLQLIFRKKRKYSESRPVIYDNLAVGAVTHLTRSLTFCKNLKFSIANYYKCLLLRKNKDN